MSSYTNPLFREYFADPFVWRHGEWYYAVGTGEGSAERAFPLLRSRDLFSWEKRGFALEKPDPGLGFTFWAPEVAYDDGVFYLYYSVGFEDKHHRLRVATSSSAEGPYRDFGVTLVDPATCPFAIDPHPFRDDDGKWYLFYARDFLDHAESARAGTALAVQPMETMTRLSRQSAVVMRAWADWQRFEKDRPMYGQRFDWHTLEGPFVRKHGGRYYLFYSGGRWENESYGVDYAVASEVMGPYVSNADHPRVLRTIPGKVIGPGHNSLVSGADGRDYIVYHAWDVARTARRLCVDRLEWKAEGPIARGPSWEPELA